MTAIKFLKSKYDHMELIKKYFYGSGKYTIKGSPYGDETKPYCFNNWYMGFCKLGIETTIINVIVFALEMGYLEKSKKKDKFFDRLRNSNQTIIDNFIDYYLQKQNKLITI
jgi:hypothetical protein